MWKSSNKSKHDKILILKIDHLEKSIFIPEFSIIRMVRMDSLFLANFLWNDTERIIFNSNGIFSRTGNFLNFLALPHTNYTNPHSTKKGWALSQFHPLLITRTKVIFNLIPILNSSENKNFELKRNEKFSQKMFTAGPKFLIKRKNPRENYQKVSEIIKFLIPLSQFM